MVPRPLPITKTIASRRRSFARFWSFNPTTLTMDELVREMTGGGTRDFSEFDAIQRGVRELAGTGLLHRPGEDEMVHPTRAAVRHSELTGGAV